MRLEDLFSRFRIAGLVMVDRGPVEWQAGMVVFAETMQNTTLRIGSVLSNICMLHPNTERARKLHYTMKSDTL